LIRESDIERYLLRALRDYKCHVRKLRFVGHRGAPDRAIMRDGKTFYVELKAPGKKVPAYQAREHERLRDVGQTVVVIDSFEAVDQFVREYINGEKKKAKRAGSNLRLSR